MRAWAVQTCDKCEGEEVIYHLECESACDHDEVCRKCNGTGWIPSRVVGIYLLAYDKGELFRTRKDALNYIGSY